ncbi:PREDICTED: uncharacterized protein LOC107338358 isoform X2 [Acropora digitifera]|uniref:uncharacterized protein LOC107338358 isoform X2 n=1 Tax=Acropora digitifera TaxID=70779 RepID=UPI00077A04BA|nr:PREDICTED: uncharacterized protein LOC107338358 isoform X2 [Acropora digitifera]
MPSYDFSKYKLARVEWKIFSPSSSLSFFYLCSFSVVFAPKRVSHPNFITFKKKVLNLEPQISPYFTKTGFTSIDTKSRPHLQPKLTRMFMVLCLRIREVTQMIPLCKILVKLLSLG